KSRVRARSHSSSSGLVRVSDRAQAVANRALLIGATDYGKGFVPLPAAQGDVALMQLALEGRGYSVRVAPNDTVRNASLLDKEIRDFCDQKHDSVDIVYFSGHGMSIDQRDWIVPAGTSRRDARASGNQRVSTDLSTCVAPNGGIVLFIIDACRDPSDDT